ncbi:SGNH/GDSL hydrolase family protein [Promicromonospora sukumoe]|uniref:SGNH/GDSL hydrolase family protein n=1 Tax=Promicromonospora sukumoe TaxID=88382 RepID=UPI00037BD99E|nr:SGNH/GDSL hydrolase family protein [Promicromonospora sukumoe]
MTGPAGRDDCFRLVALGDSITVGVGDTVGQDALHGPGWAAHLAAVLGVDEFTNLATNGARSRDVADTQLDAALALRPRLATVLVGGNDVLRSDFDARFTLADLHRCVGELCRAGTDVVLVRLPVIGLFELAPRLVRRVMRRRVASINAAVDEVAGASVAPSSSVGRTETGPSTDRSQCNGPSSNPAAAGRVVVVDAVEAIAPAGEKAWHVDRVHPSPAGHRRLAVGVAGELAGLDPAYAPDAARLPGAPDPPSARQRLVWLVRAGLPWCVRRGRDFVPGLLRSVVQDLRAERAFTQGGMVTSLADSGLDPRRRIGRG